MDEPGNRFVGAKPIYVLLNIIYIETETPFIVRTPYAALPKIAVRQSV